MPIRFQVDGDFYDHPKSIGMSDAATALWVRAGSYSAAKLTDGFVAEHVLVTLSRVPEEAADELVRRGLWRRVRGGYQYHGWGERNLTKERVEDYRAHDRERKRADRVTSRVTHEVTCKSCGRTYVTARSDSKFCSSACRKRAQRERTASSDNESSERNPNGVRTDSSRIPTPVVSVSVSESVSGSGRRPDTPPTPPSAVGPAPPPRCEEHHDDPDPPPCGRCAEARKARNRWEANHARWLRDAPKCRTHRGQLAHNCALCRAEQLAQPDEETDQP